MENHADETEKLSQHRIERDSSPAGFDDDLSTADLADNVVENEEGDVNSTAVAAFPLNPIFSFGRSQDDAHPNEVEINNTVALPVNETSNQDDEMLITRVLNNDREAFANLVEKYKAAVYNHCYRRLHSPEEAEDAAQEVFLRAYNQLHTYQFGRRFSSWLLSIAAHYCIDLLRRRRPTMDLDSIAFWKSSDQPEPEEFALTEETRDEVRDLLKKLPDKYASVVALRYWQDMSYSEIAEVTGLSVGTVKTRLFRARELLAKELDKQTRDKRGAGSRNTSEAQFVQNQERGRDKGGLLPKQVKGNQNVLP